MSGEQWSIPASNHGISRVCIFGGSGLLGAALARSLRARDVDVVVYSRRARPGQPGEARWDPAAGTIDRGPLQGTDVVVNLAGEPLDSGRWTPRRKSRLWSSRLDSTRLLVRTFDELPQAPRVLLSASAVGYYGDRGDEAVTEDATRGQGFLAELCEAWENAAMLASSEQTRVCCLRIAPVLSADGGALQRMLLPFRMGLGGRLGSGEQRFPWVAIDDAVSIMRFLIVREELDGPINVVAPESVTNAQLTEQLGDALEKPAAIPVPAFLLKLGLGELAEEALLSGANVRPRRLEVAGYKFEFPRLADALHHLLHSS
ncbi:MAG: TIGR01777 family oxidoreductase [Myxococcales bacterium]